MKDGDFYLKISFSKKCQNGRFEALFTFWSQDDIRNLKKAPLFLSRSTISCPKSVPPLFYLVWCTKPFTFLRWNHVQQRKHRLFIGPYWSMMFNEHRIYKPKGFPSAKQNAWSVYGPCGHSVAFPLTRKPIIEKQTQTFLKIKAKIHGVSLLFVCEASIWWSGIKMNVH